MKNLLQFPQNFPLTIRRLADRQNVSEVGFKADGTDASSDIVFNFDSRGAGQGQTFLPNALNPRESFSLLSPLFEISGVSTHSPRWGKKSPNRAVERRVDGSNRLLVGPHKARNEAGKLLARESPAWSRVTGTGKPQSPKTKRPEAKISKRIGQCSDPMGQSVFPTLKPSFLPIGGGAYPSCGFRRGVSLKLKAEYKLT